MKRPGCTCWCLWGRCKLAWAHQRLSVWTHPGRRLTVQSWFPRNQRHCCHRRGMIFLVTVAWIEREDISIGVCSWLSASYSEAAGYDCPFTAASSTLGLTQGRNIKHTGSLHETNCAAESGKSAHWSHTLVWVRFMKPLMSQFYVLTDTFLQKSAVKQQMISLNFSQTKP